ncbi:MAG TPA: ion channel [Myxococcales bacterium]|nr:ion channel [Myxococcales bacterium]
MAKPAPQDDTGIDVVNAPQDVWGDVYHQLLRAPWSLTLLAIAGAVLAVDVVFALAYLVTGGVANARPGSFADAFFFSVQTLGTIGYGAMYPQSTAAHLVVTVESIASLVAVALATGIVFTKFSIPVAKLEFARSVVVYLQDGVRTLAIRLANRRGNFIVEAQVRLTLIRAETSREGVFFYRLHDLPLVRDRSSALGRSWIVLHRITEGSPLEAMTPESLREADVELNVAVTGIDGTTYQTMHALHRYVPEDFRFGERFADMLSPKPDGRLQLDYTRLHDTVRATY